jgi:hypothetical protein
MTARTSIRFPEGTKAVGTARVREDRAIGRSFAERELMRRTGNQPSSEFDDIASGLGLTTKAEAFGLEPEQVAAAEASMRKEARLARQLLQPAKRPSKYRNEKCESGGIKFDSKREMMRWHDLVRMQERGEIFDLERQVPFVLAPAVVINGRKKTELRYVADFVYETKDGARVIEDVKGAVTPVYAIKRHLMAARGLIITEVR